MFSGKKSQQTLAREERAQRRSLKNIPSATGASTPALQDLVVVNWVFLPLLDSESCNVVEIPRSLFEGVSKNARNKFVKEILNDYKFHAEAASIKFHKVEGDVNLEETSRTGWEKDHKFEFIYPSESLAETIGDKIKNRRIVHLAVNALKEASITETEDVAELPEIRRYRALVRTPGKPPSTAAKSSEYKKAQEDLATAIHDGRYAKGGSTQAPPIEIFHPVFGDFLRIVSDKGHQPSVEDIRNVQALSNFLSELDETNETSRNVRTRGVLSRILGVEIYDEGNADSTRSDGVYTIMVGDKRIPVLLGEFKKELGEGSCDPSAQAAFSIRRSWLQDERNEIRDRCCCPTFLLAGGGPWLCVMGSVLTDKVIVQRLTDMMWLSQSSSEEAERMYKVARVLSALRKCLKALTEYYRETAPRIPPVTKGSPHPRFYPYPSSYQSDIGPVTFQYLEFLEEREDCVTFRAKTTPSNEPVVVKFVLAYGPEVHHFLAEKGHAPRLRYYGPLPNSYKPLPQSPVTEGAPPGLTFGSMNMVVMDYVNSATNPPPDARKQVEDVLELLHPAGYVFGDLRSQNILFDSEGKVKFIDFNWTGRYDATIKDASGVPARIQRLIDEKSVGWVKPKEGYSHYPYNINLDPTIGWPKDLGPLQSIRPAHDWYMLEKLPY
ncbi:hypothetical protein NLJ89_g4197 [Agrocybe chaxingu]|uniref:Protein kinase domain-containing protein n=1 Tax=Agrocybe chaxingu TaxID=84603 RepID=A0A9W8K909_9AGAR|nr:hypothetical protein NLJ89_g4197 [Agrocybe chaxingu]